MPSTLALVNGTLTYGETSGIDHNLTVSYFAGTPGKYIITDSENFTQLPPGWSGVGTSRASGPDTGITAGQITTGAGSDQINIQSIKQPFTVNSGPGDDTFNVNVAAAPQATYVTGQRPKAVAVGDFNGDTKLDLAVANYYARVGFDQTASYPLSILLGNGDGSFQPEATYGAGTAPNSIGIGDFNGDGKLDLAVTNSFNYTLSVLLGNGNGSFKTQVPYAMGFRPNSVVVGDLNHDGKLDLAAADYRAPGPTGGPVVGIFLGNGDGTFKPQVTFATDPGPQSLVLGDFNGDGNHDLATANRGADTLGVFLGNGDGTFAPLVTYAATLPDSLVTGDFNNDGKLDFAVGNAGNQFRQIAPTLGVLLGNGNGTFQAQTTFAAAQPPYFLAVGDFNGDGRLDLTAANGYESNTVAMFLGNGNGTFAPSATLATGKVPRAVAVADFDNNGIPDFAVANTGDNDVSVLLSPAGLTGLAAPVTVDAGSGTNRLNVSNTGGNPADRILLSTTQISSPDVPFTINYQATGGNFQGRINITAPHTVATGAAGQFPTGLAVSDFNGDSKLDAAAVNYGPSGGDSVSVLLGNGQGGFAGSSLTIPLPAGTNPFAVATGVFSGSSNVDIVTGNFVGRSIAYIAGNGNGTFKAPVLLPAMDSAGGLHKIIALAVGDLNGDAKQDIVATSGDGTYTVYLGNGNGTFNQLPSKSALTPIIGVAIANTGVGAGPSLIVAAFAAWKVGVLPGNSDGTFSIPTFTDVNGMTDQFLATGDFDGDSKTDVAVANKGSGTVSVLVGAGNGTFKPPTTMAVGFTPMQLAVSDINYDGHLDIAVANMGTNYGNGSVSVLRGNGDGTFTALPPTRVGYFPIAVAIGAFNQGETARDLVALNFVGTMNDTLTLLSTNIFAAAPTITSFSPSSGPIGTQVIITGTNFFGVSMVAFNGIRATSFVVNSPTQITVFVPTGASSGAIGVTALGGIGVSAQPFTVT